MKRLTPIEEEALCILREKGSLCPGIEASSALPEVRRILDGLVKSHRAYVEATDDGPRYLLTRRGEWEADAIIAEKVA